MCLWLRSSPMMISPLPHVLVVKDLVVDMTNYFYNQYESIKPWLKRKNSASEEGKEYPQSKEDRKKFDGMYECILCVSCSTSCPSYWRNPDSYLGLAALLHINRLQKRVLVGPSFFFRQVHGGPNGADPYPLKIEKPGLQMPKWMTRGFLKPKAKNVAKSDMDKVIIHCDVSVEPGAEGEWFVVIGLIARDYKTKKFLWFGSMMFQHHCGNPTEGEMLAIVVSTYT